MVGADFRAALVASCLRGAFPPVDLRAVCLVLAIVYILKRKKNNRRNQMWGFYTVTVTQEKEIERETKCKRSYWFRKKREITRLARE